ncbi:hypothetical protein JCM1841_001794 [Sporobolomyces salmonicolor]
MDWLADRVDSLAKQASELTVYDLKAAVNKAKAYALNLTEFEQKVREATNDDPWGASSTLMQEIAQGTFNFQLFNEVMPTIYSRFTEKEARQWRQIYKGLVLLEYLVKNGSERVIDDARSHLSLIKVLRNFHYIDENGKDQGINVRNRAKELGELLSDLDRIRQERRKAKQNRTKYTGVGNDGSGFGGGGPSFTSASGSRYGGFGSDSVNAGGMDSGYSGSSGGFRDSRPSTNDFEEYDAGDDDDSIPRRSTTASSSRTTSRVPSSASKPTPEPPKPAPALPKQEVNLFDFDDDDEIPPTPPKTNIAMPSFAAVPAAAPSAGLDGAPPPSALSALHDFDDFQSAAPAPPTSYIPPAAAPRSTGQGQNVFALLQPARPGAAASPSPSPAAAALAPLARPPALSHPSTSSSVGGGGAAPLAPSSSSAAKPATATAAAAADFSDLFAAFGSTPSAASGGAGAGAGAGGGAPGGAGRQKQSMAQIAAQKRQDQLFSMSATGGAKHAAGGGGGGGGDGWDSLL